MVKRALVACAGLASLFGFVFAAAAEPNAGPDEGARDKGAAEMGSDGFAVFRWLVSVGLEESARERLVGKGGRWEQSLVPCERPRVYLELEPEEKTFELSIESRCRGRSNVTEFDGRWDAEGRDRLVLIFPEPDQSDETLRCEIARCDDAGREDCVACQLAPDLAFELRLVRR